jgi:hypothetical protein
MTTRIGKVTFKDKKITVFPQKQETHRVTDFREKVNHICRSLPDLDTFVIVAIDKDGFSMTHFNAGSRDVDILPHLAEEFIRNQIFHNNN